MIKFCSFNRKYKKPKRFIFLFHHHSIPPLHHIKPHTIQPIAINIYLSMHASLSLSYSLCLLMNARTHTRSRSHSLPLSIFVICLCSSLVTFDVDMLRQSHQLALTSIYTIWLYFERWCVRLFYNFFFVFRPFVQIITILGKLSAFDIPFSLFSLTCTAVVCVCFFT